jgi:hypothetical protein
VKQSGSQARQEVAASKAREDLAAREHEIALLNHLASSLLGGIPFPHYQKIRRGPGSTEAYLTERQREEIALRLNWLAATPKALKQFIATQRPAGKRGRPADRQKGVDAYYLALAYETSKARLKKSDSAVREVGDSWYGPGVVRILKGQWNNRGKSILDAYSSLKALEHWQWWARCERSAFKNNNPQVEADSFTVEFLKHLVRSGKLTQK